MLTADVRRVRDVIKTHVIKVAILAVHVTCSVLLTVTVMEV